jgi:hypothetical protein
MRKQASLGRRQASRLRILKVGAFALTLFLAVLASAAVSQAAANHDAGAVSVEMLPALGIGGLIFMREPDKGGGGGGFSSQDQPEQCPAIAGDTMEAKIESAKGHVTSLWGRLTKALGDLKDKVDAYTALEGQFASLKETAESEKTEHGKTKGLLESEKTEHGKTKGRLELAGKNVERLESLCDLKGVDRTAAVPAAAGPVTDARAELVKALDNAKDASARGVAAEALRKYDAKQKATKDA